MRSACWVFLGLLTACGAQSEPEPEPEPEPDGGHAPEVGEDGGQTDAGQPGIRVGTGDDRFMPFPEDPVFELVVGPQGGGRLEGVHVLTAIELVDVTPFELDLIEVRLVDANGDVRGRVSRTPSLAPFIASKELPDLKPRIDDCCLVSGMPLIVEVEASSKDGHQYLDRVSGTAALCPPEILAQCD